MWQSVVIFFARLFGVVEKAIPPDEIRIERFNINKPRQLKRIQEWLENKWRRDTKGKLIALNLDHAKMIRRKLNGLIEWGAQPTFLEIQDGYLLFKFTKDGVEGSERIKI